MEIFTLLSVLYSAIEIASSACTTRIPRIEINDDATFDEGVWGTTEECSSKGKTNSFRIKVEGNQGDFEDDTSLNAIELTCSQDGIALKSTDGSWGNWSNTEQCSGKQYLTGFQLKSSQNGVCGTFCDQVGATDLNMKCSDGTILNGNSPSSWGSWGSWIECPSRYHICGLRTKVQASCGLVCDDSALTRVTFVCCVH